MNLVKKLESARSKAQEMERWRNFTRNQFRSIYGHLKTLEKVQDAGVFEVELKLFLARVFYKTQRGLDKSVFDFFNTELDSGKLAHGAFKNEFMKYIEAVLAYSYETIRN